MAAGTNADRFQLSGSSLRSYLCFKRIKTSTRTKARIYYLAVAALFILKLPLQIDADESALGVTVDDLLQRTSIDTWKISPDGNEVAFLTIKEVPRENVYQIELYLQKIVATTLPSKIARYSLIPQDVRDADTHRLYPAVSQFVWSPDSTSLLFTVHSRNRMELRVRNVVTGRERTVLSGHDRVELETASSDPQCWRIKTFDVVDKRENERRELPKDMALLVRDGYRFYGPLDNPKRGAPMVTGTWEYAWGAMHAREILIGQIQTLGYPTEYTWNSSRKVVESPTPPGLGAHKMRDLNEKQVSREAQLDVDVEPVRTIISIRRGQETRALYEDDALLYRPSLSSDGKFAVMTRRTNLIPDELVKLDLETGKMVSLFAPNEIFRKKTEGISVRFLPIEAGGGLFSGRLFLPVAHNNNVRYPLVFTTYLSNPGFDLSDEVPILPLVAHGIAVFAFDAMNSASLISDSGDFNMELYRVEEPRKAMEWVVKKLAGEGIVDAERVGVSGISYGAEISMYAYWKSDLFRTVSATTGSWEPMLYVMGGLGFEGYLKSRGFPKPEDGTYAEWKRLSAGLNARSTLPPLLWQSPDHEQSSCVQSWFELRRAGAQVEWLEYPDEGHVKRSPANTWWVRQRNLDWFRFWLKDEEDADPAKVEQYARWRAMRRNWQAARAVAMPN